MYLEENVNNLTKNKESLFHVLKEYSSKRTELIATLFTIFPITEVCLFFDAFWMSSDNWGVFLTSNQKMLFSIFN